MIEAWVIVSVVVTAATLFAWLSFLATVRFIVEKTGKADGLQHFSRAVTAFGRVAHFPELPHPIQTDRADQDQGPTSIGSDE